MGKLSLMFNASAIALYNYKENTHGVYAMTSITVMQNRKSQQPVLPSFGPAKQKFDLTLFSTYLFSFLCVVL